MLRRADQLVGGSSHPVWSGSPGTTGTCSFYEDAAGSIEDSPTGVYYLASLLPYWSSSLLPPPRTAPLSSPRPCSFVRPVGHNSVSWVECWGSRCWGGECDWGPTPYRYRETWWCLWGYSSGSAEHWAGGLDYPPDMTATTLGGYQSEGRTPP